MSLQELLERYFLYKVLKPASIESYRIAVRLLSQHLPEVAVDDVRQIDEFMLLKFRHTLMQRRAPCSVNSYIGQLKPIFNFAAELGVLTQNPWSKVSKIPTPSLPPKTLPHSTIEDLIAVLNKRSGSHVWWWFWLVVTKTFYYTGIRRQQLVGLRWGDVDLNNNSIVLRHSTSKTNREWSIPIPDHLAEDLKQLKQKTIEIMNGRRMTAADETSYVFNSSLFARQTRTKKLTPESVTYFYQELGKELSIQVSPHRFRHTLASTLANSGANLKVVQEFLGHTCITTTCRYIRPNVSAMREAIRCVPVVK